MRREADKNGEYIDKGNVMSRRISKWLFCGYWGTLVVMIVVSVLGSQAITRSDDLRVYLMASNIAPYNTNWVTVIRNREKPDITALMVNVPGTEDKAHMRLIEYITSDLAVMGREGLKNLIQSDTEASILDRPTYGTLIDVDPKQAKMLFYDTKADMLLLGLTMFSLPEVAFLTIATLVTLLRHVFTGRGRRALVVFTYWTKISYFVSFLSMCAALWFMSFPVFPSLLKWVGHFF
ncbi:hypothetical protein ABLV18_27395 [Klebsiella sp. CN_Kp114]|uniref:hypothetical protein n=1 Tax=unclassified Klebsiella TaxID=2608929 RepID=UPI0032B51AFC